MARLARMILEARRHRVVVGDADMARRQELRILAEQFVELSPDLARTVGERQLRQEAALAADIAEIGAARLLADQAALEQDDRAARVSQEECRRGAHDAAADHDDIGACRCAHDDALRVDTASGFTGACPRKRPMVSSGRPVAAATISAAAWPQ